MRKITLFFAALFITIAAFAADITGGTKLYLKPGSAWTQGNERFAAYFFGSAGNAWVGMTVEEDGSSYLAEAPNGTWTNVIFCRMNGANATNDWGAKWDQTADLTYDGTNNCYSITSSSNGKGSGTWGVYVPTPTTWTVAGGSATLFGSEWCTGCTANDLTEGENSVWTKVYDDVTLTAGTIEYKIVKNYGWTTSYPSENAKLVIAADGKYDVTFTFNSSTKDVNATAEAVVETPVVELTAGTKLYLKADSMASATPKVAFGECTIPFPKSNSLSLGGGSTGPKTYAMTKVDEENGIWEIEVPEGITATVFHVAFYDAMRPSTPLGYISPLSYDGTNNFFTYTGAKLKSQAVADATAGTWSKYEVVVTPEEPEEPEVPATPTITAGTKLYLQTSLTAYNYKVVFGEYELPTSSGSGTIVKPGTGTSLKPGGTGSLDKPSIPGISMTKIDEERGIWEIVAPDTVSTSVFTVIIVKGTSSIYGYISPLTFDGENDLFVLPETFTPSSGSVSNATVGTWAKYEAPRIINIAWNIEEGATLEYFESVTFTLSGVDSIGRTLGEDATGIVALLSSTPIFYSVDAEGNETAVPATQDGVLFGAKSGFSYTYSMANKGYKLVDYKDKKEVFVQKGNYRIRIPAGKIQIQPNRTGLPKVFTDQEYVLNFSIENDYVEIVEVDVPYTVAPKNKTFVRTLDTVTVAFEDVDSFKINTVESPQPTTWAFLNQTVEYEGMGTQTMPIAPLACAAKGNVLELAVPAGTAIVDGKYTITIPKGLIAFSDTTINKAITLNYSVANDTLEVTTIEELKANEGRFVLYKGIEPVTIKQGWYSFTYLSDSITALEADLYPMPAKFDAYGTLTEDGFVVESVVAIHAFNTIGDLAAYCETATDEQKAASYEIKQPAVVTLASMFSFYVQYEVQSMYGGSSWTGALVQAGPMSTYMPKSGDAIQLTGSYSPAVYDEDYNLVQPAFFALRSATVLSENNKLNYTTIDVSYGLDYVADYYASLGRLSKGGKIAEDNNGYYYVITYSDWVENPETGFYDEVEATDSLQLMIAGPVDLSAYVGVELDKLVAGVLDFDPSTGAPIFYVTELQESKLYYNNIAELIAAGSQTDYSMSSVLRNPVLLTYISHNQWAGYTIFVQDETGALAIKGLGVADENNEYTAPFPYDVKPGDMITGVEGFTTLGEGAPYMWAASDYGVEPNLEKVADGVITPLNLTMAEFCADITALQEAMWNGDSYAPKYANYVVNLKDLTKYVDPEDEKWPWLRNGNDSIQVSTYYWGDIAVPAYIASLTGIADYGIINSNGTPTIQPLNADAVIEQLVEAKNAYAYDVRVEQTEEKVIVSYALNAPAVAVRVIAKAEGEEVAAKAGSAVAQVKDNAVANTHSVEFALAELPRKEITFEVEVTGENVEAPALVPVQYGFYHSQAVDVDVNPESEFFGRVYATECMPDGVGKNYHSATKGQALYAFDATLAPIANNEGTYGFTGGLTTDAANKDPRKVRVAEDGRVFLTRQALTGVSPLVEVNPADLNANFTDVFVDFTVDAETYELKTADGKFMASPNIAFDVKGQGEDLKVFMLSTTKAGIAYNPRGNFAKEYNLGTAKTWNAEPSATIDALDTLTHYTVNYLGASVEYDNEGGIWYCQYRGTPKESEPTLIHVNAQGVEDYKDFTFVSRSSAIRFNNDFSLLAIAGHGGKKCTIFKVEKDADGKPVLNKQYEFAVNGNNVNDIAWDYANNLYIVNSSSELLYMFAMPRENAVVTTPAATRYTVDLALPDTVRFANIAAIYEKGIWEEARYADYSWYETIAILESQPTVVDVVTTSGMMGGNINNYYLNDGTGVVVLQAEGDMINPIMDEETWETIGWDTIPGLTIEVGKKLPAEFFATINFNAIMDDETYLPTGEVYGAPILTYMPKVLGVEVDEYGWEEQITEPNADFAARCEDSDFVEEAVEANLADVLANRIKYAGQLLKVDTTANYYAEVMMDHFSGAEKTTAYFYWDAETAFEVESYEEEGVTYVFVNPKYTEDYYNYAGQLFNVIGENLPAAAFDGEVTMKVANVRFDWNSVAMGQSIILKEGWKVEVPVIDDVDNNELVVNIYSNNGAVYVETEAGAMIEVYTVNGLRVFAGVSNTNTTVINGLNTNVAIIRVNGEAYKVMVK